MMVSVQLYRGDCLDVLPTLADNSVHAVICDLPYGTTRNHWDCAIPLDDLWAELRRIVKPHGAIVLFAVQPFSSELVGGNRKGYKHRWIWNKRQPGNFAVAKYMPMTIDEEILVFTGRGERVNYYPQMTTGKMRTKGGRKSKKNGRGFGGIANIAKIDSDQYFPKSILDFQSVPRIHREHPSQKPVELLSYLIRTYTHPGEMVIDMTMGAGSTGVACVQTGRNFIGIEMNTDYFAIAQRRINAAAAPLSASEVLA